MMPAQKAMTEPVIKLPLNRESPSGMSLIDTDGSVIAQARSFAYAKQITTMLNNYGRMREALEGLKVDLHNQRTAYGDTKFLKQAEGRLAALEQAQIK